MKTIIAFIITLFAATASFAQQGELNGTYYNLKEGQHTTIEVADPPLNPNPGPVIAKGNNVVPIVFYLHGLNGDINSLSRFREYALEQFPKATYVPLSYYNQQNELTSDSAGLMVLKQMNQAVIAYQNGDFETAKQNYVICHSMGGVVIRRVEEIIERLGVETPYGGIITFASPHKGAKLAETKVKSPEVVAAFFSDMCKSLGNGPALDELYGNFWGRAFNRLFFGKIADIAKDGNVCDYLSTLVVDIAASVLSKPMEAILVPDGEELTELAEYPRKEKKLVTLPYYGKSRDNDDMAHRFLFSVMENPNDYPLFTADTMDIIAIKTATEFRDKYVAGEALWMKRAKNTSFLGNWYSGKYFTQGELYDIANGYKAGVTFFDNLNYKFKYLVGAAWPEIVDTTSCACRVYDGYEDKYYDVWIDCNDSTDCQEYADNNTSFAVRMEEYEYKIFETPHDGLVAKESAIALPNSVVKYRELIDNTHFMMKNSNAAGIELQQIHNGDIHPHFQIEK